MKRFAVLLAITACALLGVGATAARASEPVMHACAGTTFSEDAREAQAGPPGTFGQLVSGSAQAPGTERPGLGDGIQQLQAGLVPDTVAANTCNN
jgi:hypothetical protein